MKDIPCGKGKEPRTADIHPVLGVLKRYCKRDACADGYETVSFLVQPYTFPIPTSTYPIHSTPMKILVIRRQNPIFDNQHGATDHWVTGHILSHTADAADRPREYLL